MDRRTPRWTLLACLLACAGAQAQQGPGEFDQGALEAACRQQPGQAEFEACMAEGQPPMTAEEQAAATRSQAALSAWYTRVAAASAARGGAMDLAFAATLRQLAAPPGPRGAAGAPARPPADAQAAKWRQQAAALAGNDAVANAFVVIGAEGAQADAAAQRWAAAQPDNIAPLLRQEQSIDALLRAAAARTRFDLLGYQQVRWMTQTFERTPPTAAEDAAISPDADGPRFDPLLVANGLWNGLALPSMAALAQACGEEGLQATPARRDGCRHVAQVMADTSDTAIVERLGLHLLAAAARTDAERSVVAARERTFDWQMQQWARLASAQADGGIGDLARLLKDPSVTGERILVQRLLAEAGVPLAPPANWQPPAQPQSP